MKTHLFLLILLFLLFSSCRKKASSAMFQGEWLKKGEYQSVFIVQADSIYFQGANKGYFYQFYQDTLIIHFTEQITKNPIVYFNDKELVALDASAANDTIHLFKREIPVFKNTTY